jgi:hypothetical protein
LKKKKLCIETRGTNTSRKHSVNTSGFHGGEDLHCEVEDYDILQSGSWLS